MITAVIVFLLVLCSSFLNLSRRENDIQQLDNALKEVRSEKALLQEVVANQKDQLRQMEKTMDDLQYHLKHQKILTKLMGSGTIFSVGYHFYPQIAPLWPDR